nr:zinc finger BED domain-containing protein RICESLEEPER 2 [Tanacetum cinerariifolium]
MIKRVIAFEDFPAHHSGSALVKTLRNVFVNFNLENKIMSITLDNASNNTSAIGKLKLKYEPPMEAKETTFLILSRIAINILSVQATLVASESAFSTSGRVLSTRRTRLTPASLEMCMCLKDHLDAQECEQDKSTLETPIDFEEEILDAEVQANEAIPKSDEEIALDAAGSEGFMSEPGSGEEKDEAEAESLSFGASIAYSMPPKQYSPFVSESIASIADLLSKLVKSQTAFNAQLKIIIEKQQQTLSVISPIVQTNQRDSNTPTIATPPTSTQPIILLPSNNHGLQICPATLEKPMAQVITVPSSSITKMENEVTVQLQTPLLPALASPTNPVNKSSKVQHEIVILHPTHLYNHTCHLATLAKDKFTLG